jgi:hypothetical protein
MLKHVLNNARTGNKLFTVYLLFYCSISISLYMRKIAFSFLSVHDYLCAPFPCCSIASVGGPQRRHLQPWNTRTCRTRSSGQTPTKSKINSCLMNRCWTEIQKKLKNRYAFHVSFNILQLTCLSKIHLFGIARHRHLDQCRRHRHSGIGYLSPVPKHSGTGLVPRISVPDWFRHRHFCSFWYRTDRNTGCRTVRHYKNTLQWKDGPILPFSHHRGAYQLPTQALRRIEVACQRYLHPDYELRTRPRL